MCSLDSVSSVCGISGFAPEEGSSFWTLQEPGFQG